MEQTPPELIRDITIVMMYHIQNGNKEFDQVSQKMVAELGEKVRPYLNGCWKMAQEQIKNQVNVTEEPLKAEESNKKPRTLMKVLRLRIWPMPSTDGAMTQAIRVSSLSEPIEQAINSMCQNVGDALVTNSIIEMDEGSSDEDINYAIEEADKSTELIEKNMAILFHYTAQLFNNIDKQIVARRRAPFGQDNLADVLQQLKWHSKYRGQIIIAIDQEGNTLAMHEGKIVKLKKSIREEIESQSVTLAPGISVKKQFSFGEEVRKYFIK